MLRNLLVAVGIVLGLTPVVRAQEIVLQGEITQSLTLSPPNTYLLRGYVYVKNGATLTIAPGTLIRGEKATKGTLVITRNAKISADGTAENPILFTSSVMPGQRNVGDWGGVVILGRAPSNCIGDCIVEGGLNNANGDGLFGGSDAEDSSGVFRYVRIDWAGIAIQPDNEINGLTMGGVGRKTVVEYVAIGFSGDDALEIFGGTVNVRHFVAFGTVDDDIDTDFGWQGNLQHALVMRYPNRFDVSLSNGSESDNNKNGFLSSPFTAGALSNVTFIGPRLPGGPNPNAQFNAGANYKAATRLKIFNSVIMGWPAGVIIEGQACENHAGQDELKFEANAIIDCPTAHQLNLSGATPTLNIANWFTANLNQTFANHTAAGINNPYRVQGSAFSPDATLAASSALRTMANWADGYFASAGGFFQQVGYVGGFDAVRWTDCWVNWSPQQDFPTDPVPCLSASDDAHIATEGAFAAWPNPFRERLEVVVPGNVPGRTTLTLVDGTGRIALSQTIVNQGSEKQLVVLDVGHISSGAYVLVVQNQQAVHSFRVVR